MLKPRQFEADLTVEVTKLKRPELLRLPESRLLRGVAEGVDPARRDSGDNKLGWLTRIVVGIALAGIVAFDGLSIGVAHVSAADDANTAARSASHAWLDQHDLNAAVQAAQTTASEHDEIVVANSVRVQTDGTVDLKIERDATTLVVRHIHALHSWLTIVASGSGKYVGS